MSFSIGITTFKNRFNRVLFLLDKIRSRGNWPILLSVNGEHNEKFNEEYRKVILHLASNVENCFVSMFTEFRSLSKLWNTLLITSHTDWNLILNDDVVINDEFPFESLEAIANNHPQPECFALNGSFSHYFINRRLVAEVGWFEERLLGIGEEDTDMVWRIENTGKKIYKPSVKGILNIHDGQRPNNIKTGEMHYSAYNRNFIFNEKYKKDDSGIKGMFETNYKNQIEHINAYPNEIFYWNNKNKLS